VMAFPKNNRGQDMMSQSPSEVDQRQLRDLRIRLADEPPGSSETKSPLEK
jgi:aspartyl-tRNA synthetase